MSVVTQGQILVQSNSNNPTTIIGGDGGISPLPYLSITYSSGSAFLSDSSFNIFDNSGTEINAPFSWSIVDWGDGTIERNIPNTTVVTHSYNSGAYTANFYTLASNLNTLKSILLDGQEPLGVIVSNTVVLNYNLKSVSNLTHLSCRGRDPITSFDVSYLPLLTVFNFENQPNLTYTAGDLGKNNPFLKTIVLSDCGLSTTEVNNILVDIQTYCLNNSGSLNLSNTGLGSNNSAPTTGPPNGIAARTALTAAGWTVNTA